MTIRRYVFTLHGLVAGYDGAPYAADRTERPTPLDVAVLASLLTWRRDDGDDGPEQGWWADTFDERPLGSRLWLLARERLTTQTVERARQYAQEALDWLVNDGLATAVEVAAERNGTERIDLQVTVIRDERAGSGLVSAELWRQWA
jgi:phage gp46-like protein